MKNIFIWCLLFVMMVILLVSVEAQKKNSDKKILPGQHKRHRKGNSKAKTTDTSMVISEERPVKKQMAWLNFTEANKEISQLIRKRYRNEKAMLKKPKRQDKKKKREKDCHSIAMLQCGCNALSSFESEMKTFGDIAFPKKCEIRENFFKCLDGASTAVCRHANRRLIKPKSAFKQRMREIVRVLWTTRGCILGTDDNSQNLKELQINSRFCSPFYTVKNGVGKKKNGPAKKNLNLPS